MIFLTKALHLRNTLFLMNSSYTFCHIDSRSDEWRNLVVHLSEIGKRCFSVNRVFWEGNQKEDVLTAFCWDSKELFCCAGPRVCDMKVIFYNFYEVYNIFKCFAPDLNNSVYRCSINKQMESIRSIPILSTSLQIFVPFDVMTSEKDPEFCYVSLNFR